LLPAAGRGRLRRWRTSGCGGKLVQGMRGNGLACLRDLPFRAKEAIMSSTVTGQSGAHSRVDEVLEGLGPNRVVILHPDEVRAYLGRHPEGLPLLVPIAARARQEFPEPAQLSLETCRAPETAEPALKPYVR